MSKKLTAAVLIAVTEFFPSGPINALAGTGDGPQGQITPGEVIETDDADIRKFLLKNRLALPATQVFARQKPVLNDTGDDFMHTLMPQPNGTLIMRRGESGKAAPEGDAGTFHVVNAEGYIEHADINGMQSAVKKAAGLNAVEMGAAATGAGAAGPVATTAQAGAEPHITPTATAPKNDGAR